MKYFLEPIAEERGTLDPSSKETESKHRMINQNKLILEGVAKFITGNRPWFEAASLRHTCNTHLLYTHVSSNKCLALGYDDHSTTPPPCLIFTKQLIRTFVADEKLCGKCAGLTPRRKQPRRYTRQKNTEA